MLIKLKREKLFCDKIKKSRDNTNTLSTTADTRAPWGRKTGRFLLMGGDGCFEEENGAYFF